MKISDFRKFVNSLEKEELMEELLVLYTKLKDVKTHYSMELGEIEDRNKIYEHAKKEISKRYATKSLRRPRKPRIRAINKLLNEMHKKSIFEHEMIDIYLFNVECANNFLNRHDFYSDPLFNTMVNSFSKAIDIIKESVLENEYQEHCYDISNNCKSYLIRKVLRQKYDSAFNTES